MGVRDITVGLDFLHRIGPLHPDLYERYDIRCMHDTGLHALKIEKFESVKKAGMEWPCSDTDGCDL